MKKVVWFVSLSLLLVSALSVPHDVISETKTAGLVQGKTSEPENKKPAKNTEEPHIQVTPSPSLSPVPTPISSHQPLVSPSPTPKAVAETNEALLLNEEIIIDNQTHVFAIPSDWKVKAGESKFVEITFKMETEEKSLGFDDPGLILSVNNEPIYQLAAQEIYCQENEITSCKSDWTTRQFVIDANATTISVWAGNTGDDQKPTRVTVKKIEVYAAVPTTQSDVQEITDLIFTKDSAEFATLEWTSPNVLGDYLDRALSYDFRWSENQIGENISAGDWKNLPPVEIVLPQTYKKLPRQQTQSEIQLIKLTTIYTHLLLRPIDWQGNFGPISTVKLE